MRILRETVGFYLSLLPEVLLECYRDARSSVRRRLHQPTLTGE